MVTLRNLILIDSHAWDDNHLGLLHSLKRNTISAHNSNNYVIIPERNLNQQEPKYFKYPIMGNSFKIHVKSGLESLPKELNALLKTANLRRFYVTDIKSERVISVTPNIISISKLENLVEAYESIKSKPGNMTEGSDKTTLDGISIKYLENISNDLKTGKFKAQPGRVVMIPKPGKTEKRKLILASPREKVVQKALAIQLNNFYDKKMSNNSHGFRPNRSVQTCINQIDQTFQSARFVIEGDLRKAFDSISHSKLLEVLGKEIRCVKTLTLIKKLITAGNVEDGIVKKADVGTPQGSVVSPILCNIFLSGLDDLMDNIKQKYDSPGRGLSNPEYMSIANKLKRNRQKDGDITERKILLKKLLTTPSKSEKKISINYVRYADDFIIGVEGPKSLAVQIRDEVKSYLSELDLTLNMDKTKITDFYNDPIRFLGYDIKSLENNDKAYENIYSEKLGRKITRRKKVRLSFEAPYKEILDKLTLAKIVCLRTRKFSNDKNDLTHRGTFRGNLIHLDHPDILIYYNSIIRGIYNYYCICRNEGQLFNIL